MSFALGVIVKTTILLACASLMTLALRRASASVKHTLWSVVLLAAYCSRWRRKSFRNFLYPYCQRRLSALRILRRPLEKPTTSAQSRNCFRSRKGPEAA